MTDRRLDSTEGEGRAEREAARDAAEDLPRRLEALAPEPSRAPLEDAEDAAFRALYVRHRRQLLSFLRHHARSLEEAEDVLQETFLSLWRKRDRHAPRNGAAFLKTVGYRLFLNARTKESRRERMAPSSDDPDATLRLAEEAEQEERLVREQAMRLLMRRVEAELAELPAASREAFLLFRVEGLSIAEIAERTGVPAKTVETRVRRATMTLGRRMGDVRNELPGR